jgi:methyl-accepting chemotaxis protein
MNVLARLKIGMKLLLAPGVALLLLILISAVLMNGVLALRDSLNTAYETRMPNLKVASQLERVTLITQASTSNLLSKILAGFTPDKLEDFTSNLTSDLQDTEKELDVFLKTASTIEEERKLITQGVSELKTFEKIIIETIELASIDASMATTYMSRAEAQFTKLSAIATQLVDLERRLGEQDREIAAATVQKIILQGAACAVLALVLAAIAIWFVRRDILQSIATIRSALARLAEGDLRNQVPVTSRDEIGDMARTTNEVIGNLQCVVGEVLSGATKVTSAAKNLAGASRSLSDRSERQSSAATTIAATVEELTVSISSISDGTEMLKQASQASARSTRQGGESLQRLTAEIGAVRSSFDSINQSVGDFVKDAMAITAMTRQVKDLAHQTNLLALNAAIEAARAGEQGRGFAVVADEVRGLAERSAQAASDIDKVTAAISTKSDGVEASLKKGTGSLSSCESHLGELEHVFSNAAESVNRSNDNAEEIALSVREQSAASTNMAVEMESIARMAEENSTLTSETSSFAGELETLAIGMQDAVKRFKV